MKHSSLILAVLGLVASATGSGAAIEKATERKIMLEPAARQR